MGSSSTAKRPVADASGSFWCQLVDLQESVTRTLISDGNMPAVVYSGTIISPPVAPQRSDVRDIEIHASRGRENTTRTLRMVNTNPFDNSLDRALGSLVPLPSRSMATSSMWNKG